MLPEVFYFLKGYVIIKIKGSFPEKFINIALKRDIYIWDIKRIDKNTMTMKISVKGYFKLKGITKKSACKMTIVHKKGLPFKIKKHKKRTAFFAGIIVFCAAVIMLSNILWQVEITGNQRIPYELLNNQLVDCGLKPGIRISQIDTVGIAQKMIAKNNEITWIGINLKGTKAFVEVVEGVPKPQIVEKDMPCNIVSTKNGVVEQYIVKNGFPVVKKGDTVEQGQLLVSGASGSPYQSVRLVHSDAEIKVRTWHEANKEISLVKNERIPTGDIKNKYKLVIGNFTLNLFFSSKVPYNDYDIKTTEKYFFNLPIKLQKVQNIQITPKSTDLTPEEAYNENVDAIQNDIINALEKDASVVETYKSYTTGESSISIKVVVETIESTGEKVKIDT